MNKISAEFRIVDILAMEEFSISINSSFMTVQLKAFIIQFSVEKYLKSMKYCPNRRFAFDHCYNDFSMCTYKTRFKLVSQQISRTYVCFL